MWLRGLDFNGISDSLAYCAEVSEPKSRARLRHYLTSSLDIVLTA
jgi:hypothetical protein